MPDETSCLSNKLICKYNEFVKTQTNKGWSDILYWNGRKMHFCSLMSFLRFSFHFLPYSLFSFYFITAQSCHFFLLQSSSHLVREERSGRLEPPYSDVCNAALMTAAQFCVSKAALPRAGRRRGRVLISPAPCGSGRVTPSV